MRVQKDYKGKGRRDAHFVGISQVKQGYWNFAWKLLPYSAFPCSAFVELTAVVLFAIDIFGTPLHPPAHLRAEIHSLSSTRGAA